MTLVEHLAELRRRLMVSVLAVGAGGLICWIFYESILTFLEHPLCRTLRARGPAGCHLYIFSPLDPLAIRFKVSAYGGLALALPVVLYQLWRFVTPGLNPKERRYVVPFIVASMGFFGFGALMAWLTFPHALAWLTGIGGHSLQPLYSPTNYLSLILILMLVFGIAFEFPVVLVSLEVARVLTPAKLSSWRRWAIVAITAFAAVATPSSDPFSMLGMMIPMYLFYEISILFGRLLKR
ncbi:MAG: twin-arginine translocase subunit TatC [Acidimicrobiales bacterium]